MRQDDDLIAAAFLLFGKHAADCGTGGEDAKDAAGQGQRSQLLRPADIVERNCANAIGTQLLEHRVLASPIEVVERRNRVPLLADGGVALPHHDDLVRIGVGQRLQQHRIHHAEDCGVRADAEGERHDGDRGEPQISAHHPERISRVLCDVGQQRAGTDTARALFHGIDAADFDERGTPRRLGRLACGDFLVGQQVDVPVDVRAKVIIAPAAAQQIPCERTEPLHQRPARCHDAGPSAWPIASAMRRQLASSTCSCFLPSRVNR